MLHCVRSPTFRIATVITAIHAIGLIGVSLVWLYRLLVEVNTEVRAGIGLVLLALSFGVALAWCAWGLHRGNRRFVGAALVWQLIAVMVAANWFMTSRSPFAIVLGTSALIGGGALVMARAEAH